MAFLERRNGWGLLVEDFAEGRDGLLRYTTVGR
jgi:hypothetical protein